MPRGRLNRLAPGRTGWCGPAAMTVVTGKSYDDCCRALLKVREGTGRSAIIKGTRMMEVREALKLMGVEITHTCHNYMLGQHTLSRFLRDRSKEWRDSYIILSVKNHWITVKGNKAWDYSTPDNGTWISRIHFRRARVHNVIVCSARGRTRRVK